VATTYEIVTRNRAGAEHVRRYTSEDTLAQGSVVALGGRYWLVDRVDHDRLHAVPARYRLTLRHPDGHDEPGAFRRYGPDAPRTGHYLTTLEDGAPITWAVVMQQLARDESGEPFIDSIAERDYAERESLPDHQLEHTLDRGEEDGPAALLTRATAAGLSVELVALEAGQAPDWDEATRFLDSLIIEEVNDDLLETCGVDPGHDPPETWIDTVKNRLRADLESFRDDVAGDHDEIEEWDFRGGRIFAVVGTRDDEANPLSGYGWMCRLVDAGVLEAAGMPRVHKAGLTS
jgi:hypothetical protein